jgi:hypothetical protein
MAATLRHPLGLTLLGISLVLAVATYVVPALRPWSPRAPWIVVWGVVAYAAAVLVTQRTRADAPSPEERKLIAIREAMQARLSERLRAEGHDRSTELTRVLSEAIAQLDRQVIPALRQLLKRQVILFDYLAAVENNSLPTPSPDVLKRLRAIHARRQAAIEECVQQAANAHGTLEAMLQAGDEIIDTGSTRSWAKDLLTLYDVIEEVLHPEPGEEEELDEIMKAVTPEDAIQGVFTPRPSILNELDPASPGSSQLDALATGVSRSNSRGREKPPSSSDGFDDLVTLALRRLNDPASLSRCDLAKRLPYTLGAVRLAPGEADAKDSTSLKQSQALREVLIRAIEDLKPSKGRDQQGSPEALQYNILYQAYVRGNSNNSIMVRYSISESTFHRHRRGAISAIARELMEQETLLRGQASRRQTRV